MILLLGATGYVGEAFVLFFKNNDIDFITASVRYPLDKNAFRNLLLKNNVTHVFNCAGYTGKPNVDACELNKDATLLANAILPKQIADVCKSYGIRLIHVSSGCIYNDVCCERALPPLKEYTEQDAPNFCFNSNKYSWYSATKALGEQLLQQTDAGFVTIARLRIPFNGEINNRNYIDKILKYPILLNATNSFSHLNEFVQAAFTIRNISGIFNLTQPGYLTTQQVVQMLQQHNLAVGKEFYKSIEDFDSIVKAPRSNCTLDSSNAIRCGVKLTCIDVAMEQAIGEYAFNLKQQNKS